DFIESGDMKSLGVLSEERLDNFPDIPTFKEQGVDMTINRAIYWAFPPKTPENVVNKFSEALEVVSQNKEFQEKAEELSLDPTYMNPDEATEFLSEKFDRYEKNMETFEEKNKD